MAGAGTGGDGLSRGFLVRLPVSRDLRHGHDAILVPPEDPRALAAAMARLDEDDELLERLAAGARRSASHRTVDAWARLLIEGAPPQAAWTMEPDGRGPWYAWPA